MHFIKINLFLLLGVYCSIDGLTQGIQFVNKVYEYKPAPGQFINTPLGFPAAAQSIIGEMHGGVSLGAFGGYIVVGFEKPIENDPDNPYGIDFTVFGNANQSSSEPAVVYVMRDENSNNLPDDTWYLLAGSNYWFNSSVKNYEITYFNPGGTIAKDVLWEDNQGNFGSILADTNFHKQSYYPINDSFPNIQADKYMLRGAKISDRIDRTMLDYITTKPMPFGYADNLPRNNSYKGWEPNNPYTTAAEGTGADAFDINWAVDADGNYIDLEQIDFIKIQTGVNALAGWLGEISTEITGVVDVEPNITIKGEGKLIVIEPFNTSVSKGTSLELKAFAFDGGRLKSNENIQWLSTNADVASISPDGKLQALTDGHCFIYAKWLAYPEIKDSIKIKVPFSTNILQDAIIDLIVYPNPVNEILFLSENNGFTHFTVSDLMGKWQMSANFSGNQIQLEKLQSGFYFIDIEGEGIRVRKKIIKN